MQANEAATETASSKTSLLRFVVEGVQHQRVPHKKFVLKFLHDRFAGLGPASPVDVAQRIAVPIIAQRDELLAAPHVGRQRHAAFLIAHRAGQRDGRNGIALGQNQNRLRRRQLDERAEQSQRVGPRQRHPGETQDPAPQRQRLPPRTSPRRCGGSGGTSRLLQRRPCGTDFSGRRCARLERADAPAFGQLKRQPFRKSRARVGEVFQQRQARPGFWPSDFLPARGSAAAGRPCRSAGSDRVAENSARKKRLPARASSRNASNSAKRLIGHGVLDVHAHRAGDDQAASHAQPRRREPPARPMPQPLPRGKSSKSACRSGSQFK